MTDDEEQNLVKETHEMVTEMRRDLYTARPSDGTTLLQRVARLADGVEAMSRAGRLAYWVLGGLAAIILGWAQFKDSLLKLLLGQS